MSRLSSIATLKVGDSIFSHFTGLTTSMDIIEETITEINDKGIYTSFYLEDVMHTRKYEPVKFIAYEGNGAGRRGVHTLYTSLDEFKTYLNPRFIA